LKLSGLKYRSVYGLAGQPCCTICSYIVPEMLLKWPTP
jgi:hypothetical protein